MLSSLGKLLLNLLYPPHCCCCEKFGGYLCSECAALIDIQLFPIRLPQNSVLDSITASFTHSSPIKDLIADMKYCSVINVAYLLGELLYLHTQYPDANVVTSVPLTKEKQRIRGFNQSAEMAKKFSKQANIPYLQLLKKTTSSFTSQASLHSRVERLQNIHLQTFSWISPPQLPARVLIIDDVFTTGATLSACAAVLKEHGVQQVHGLVVAHGM